MAGPRFNASLPPVDRKVPKTTSPGSCFKESKVDGLGLSTSIPQILSVNRKFKGSNSDQNISLIKN